MDHDTAAPHNADIGDHHLAFYVEDMTAAVSYLKEQGIKVIGEPTTMTEGPTEGESWVYFMAPWGMQLELVSYPNSKAYAKHASVRLFDPR
ncbi:TPA: VOC family protein [Photobacterium damselae]|uniref:VOC family protein n=1 Tax=Photobacterium damselae TaxID=38293 RepID=UPI0021596713|nr:VOC family protein [Photobacterium damselae]